MNLYLSSSTEGKAQRKREKQTGSSLCFFSLRFSQVSAEKQTDGGPDASICFRDFEAVEQLYMQYKQSDCSVMCIWKQSALGLQRCAFHGFPSGINVIVFVKIFIKIKNGHGILWSCCSVGKSGVLLDE